MKTSEEKHKSKSKKKHKKSKKSKKDKKSSSNPKSTSTAKSSEKEEHSSSSTSKDDSKLVEKTKKHAKKHSKKSKKNKKAHHLKNSSLAEVDDDESGEDMFADEQNEDKEIMESIKYAEKKLNSKMPTPVKLQSDGHSPVKYDTDIDAI